MIRQVERLATLAAIDLAAGAGLLPHLVAEFIPALKVTGADLALLGDFVAGSLPRLARLDLGAVAEGGEQVGVGRFPRPWRRFLLQPLCFSVVGAQPSTFARKRV